MRLVPDKQTGGGGGRCRNPGTVGERLLERPSLPDTRNRERLPLAATRFDSRSPGISSAGRSSGPDRARRSSCPLAEESGTSLAEGWRAVGSLPAGGRLPKRLQGLGRAPTSLPPG